MLLIEYNRFEVKYMKQNVGRIDQYVRYGLSLALIVGALVSGIWWIAIFAVVPAFTGYTRSCPMYRPFKLSTVQKSELKK
jgi:hypothetical protein